MSHAANADSFSSAGFARASLGEVSEGAVEAPSDGSSAGFARASLGEVSEGAVEAPFDGSSVGSARAIGGGGLGGGRRGPRRLG